MDLNHARLPIPPRGPKEGEIIADKSRKSIKPSVEPYECTMS
jgi:hypothetical protein